MAPGSRNRGWPETWAAPPGPRRGSRWRRTQAPRSGRIGSRSSRTGNPEIWKEQQGIGKVCFQNKSKFITEDQFTKHMNITIK